MGITENTSTYLVRCYTPLSVSMLAYFVSYWPSISYLCALFEINKVSIYECINLARNSEVIGKDRMKAVNCLKESVKKDPNYADAWVWLADRTRHLYADYPDQENNHLLDDASKYIENALRLDPKSSKGLQVKATIEFHKKNWEQMFSAANRAFEQNSGCLLYTSPSPRAS